MVDANPSHRQNLERVLVLLDEDKLKRKNRKILKMPKSLGGDLVVERVHSRLRGFGFDSHNLRTFKENLTFQALIGVR